MQWRDAAPAAGNRGQTGQIALSILCCLLMVWAVAFLASRGVRAGPSGTSMAGDFAIFLAASGVAHQGSDPYNRRVLYRQERSMLNGQHVSAPRPDAFIRVGNPPAFFLSIEPLTRVPFRIAASLWLLLLAVLLLTAARNLLGAFAWEHPAPLLVFLAMPQSLLAVYYGNLDALMLAALVAAYIIAARRPFTAGMLLSLTLLKPQVALACAALVLLFATVERRRAIAGLVAGSLLVLGPWALLQPQLTMSWLSALTGYSRELSVQPDIASLSGIYVYYAPWLIRSVVQAGGIAGALLLTGWWMRRLRGVPRPVPLACWAWLLVLWFLVSPFAHFHDEVLLALPVLALLGHGGSAVRSRESLFVLYCLVLSLLLFPTARLHLDLQSVALLPLAVALFRQARNVTVVQIPTASISRGEAVRVS